MSHAEQLSPRQLWATLLAAASTPAFGLCVGLGWDRVLSGGILAAVLLCLLFRLAHQMSAVDRTVPGRLLRLLAAAVSLLLAAWAAAWSAGAFPETGESPWSGLLVLGLAAWMAWQDSRILARCGAVLAPALGLLFGALLISAMNQADPAWIRQGEASQTWKAGAFLLTPSLGLCLAPRLQTGRTAPGPVPLALLILIPALAAALTAGCLSPVTAAKPGSFHLLAQSVSVLGVMHRFEALASAAELTGCCLLCALALTALFDSLALALPRKLRRPGKAAALVLCALAVYPVSGLNPAVLFGLNAISCVIWTIALLVIELQKKFAFLRKKC